MIKIKRYPYMYLYVYIYLFVIWDLYMRFLTEIVEYFPYFRISAWVSVHGDVFASPPCERWRYSFWWSCFSGIVSVGKKVLSNRAACPKSSPKNYTISLTGPVSNIHKYNLRKNYRSREKVKKKTNFMEKDCSFLPFDSVVQ